MSTVGLLITFRSPESWTVDALCVQTDAALFFPELGASSREAIRICHQCPCVDACLEYALRNDEQFGVWGGVDAKARKALKRGTARPAVCRNGHDLSEAGINKSGRCCRCATDNQRRATERKRHGLTQQKPPSQHGSRSRYNQGCHCEPCTAANREYVHKHTRRRRGLTLGGAR